MAHELTHGTTLSGATSGTIAALLTLDPISIERESVETTTWDTTDGRTHEPNSVYDLGTLSGTIELDVTALPPYTAANEVWTVTFPSGTTWKASGHITTVSPTGAGGAARYEASFAIKLSGALTIV